MSAAGRILLLDTGNEWGGGTNSMFEFLRRHDRARFAITCCFYKDYRRGAGGPLLSEELSRIGIPLQLLPTRTQPLWAKLGKEMARATLAWSEHRKKRAVAAIERRWRIEPRAALLAELLRTGGYDLLYMNNQPASNQEGYVAAVQAGLPVVQHCRTEPKLSTQEVALVNRAASRVICVSSGVRDKLVARGVDAARLSVVYNAIDGRAELPAAATAPAGDGLVIGSVGQLVARKATGDLLRALAILHGERRPLRCVILGEGPQRAELEELARSLGIAAQVHFMGFQAQPLAFIQSMDLFVICSPSEGLPRVVLEAMLAQKPVIGSDVTGTRELVLPEQNGLLYPYGDVPALSAALRRLMDDAALRRRMGAAGRARVLAEFSMQGYVDGISEVLTGALR